MTTGNGNPIGNGEPYRGPCKVCGRERCCGAKIRRPGRYGDYRHHTAPMANGRCRIHGGTTPKGPASKNWKHGRYSIYVPKHLREIYDRLHDDKELLNLSHNVAMLAAKEDELGKEYDEEERPDWRGAIEAYNKFLKDKTNNAENLAALGKVLEEGADRAATRDRIWRKIVETGQEKRDMVMAESKRRMDLEGMMDVREGLATVTMALDMLVEIAKNPTIAREDIPRVAYEHMAKLMPIEVKAEVVA